ncbi:hypothetical protein [Bradyrhizobium stylosanthis]|uniref:hypothetical protein n=1 Tax=Bradyrhizobium stylosanthis TaxID=1803665 RepID=UPI0007C49321|nr:hypothetical protein [Bradyrhizobium stylosanthis]
MTSDLLEGRAEISIAMDEVDDVSDELLLGPVREWLRREQDNLVLNEIVVGREWNQSMASWHVNVRS